MRLWCSPHIRSVVSGIGDAENEGAENAGVENAAPDSKGGKRGSGNRGSLKSMESEDFKKCVSDCID